MFNPCQDFSANPHGRDFVCGDIHGQLGQLQSALNKLAFNTRKDRLFALGDLVDRGADSPKVFSLLEEPWFFSIRGNHEQLMFDALEKQLPSDIQTWRENGGDTWFSSLGDLIEGNPNFINLVNRQRKQMPWSIEIALNDGRKVGLVHAEVPIPDWQLFRSHISDTGSAQAQLRFNALWSRNIQGKGYETGVQGIDLCVHGHCVFQEPVRQHNRCFIDTGAYVTKKSLFGLKQQPLGYLSVIQLEDLFKLPELSLEAIHQKRLSRK